MSSQNMMAQQNQGFRPKVGQKSGAQKQLPPHVSRTFRRKEVTKSGLERILTVCYDYDREGKTLKYGACMFRREEPGTSFRKKAHLETAEARLRKTPVVIANFEDAGNINEFHDKIRKQIFREGVKGHRIKNQ